MFDAQVVDGLRGGEAAHAPGLDVDDSASPEFEGKSGVPDRPYGFVETDGGLQFTLEACVVAIVVMRERLLDHHEFELVQLLQPR